MGRYSSTYGYSPQESKAERERAVNISARSSPDSPFNLRTELSDEDSTIFCPQIVRQSHGFPTPNRPVGSEQVSYEVFEGLLEDAWYYGLQPARLLCNLRLSSTQALSRSSRRSRGSSALGSSATIDSEVPAVTAQTQPTAVTGTILAAQMPVPVPDLAIPNRPTTINTTMDLPATSQMQGNFANLTTYQLAPPPSAPSSHPNGLGTWAERKFVLPLPQSNARHPSNGLPLDSGAGGQLFPSPFSQAQPVPTSNPRCGDEEEEEEAMRAAAWRWRFCQRWKAEQAKVLDPNSASAGVDNTEEALLYLKACCGGWNHLARTESSDNAGLGRCSVGTLGTLGTSSLLGADLLASEDSYNPRSTALASCEHVQERESSATREVVSVAKRAQKLLEQQAAIEKQAEERWKELCGNQHPTAWVGDYLETVEIDDWGKFRFIVLRVRDRGDRQKILVRGKNYSPEATLVEEVQRQVMSLSTKHEVAYEASEVLGGGVMEWRRDRDRHLHIHSGIVYSPSNGNKAMPPLDLIKLAGVLTRQYLPMHYKVSIDGYKVI